MINFRLDLDKSFQEVLFRIDNCVDKKSCWIVEILDAEYVNISVYSPLPRSTYIKLHCELKNSVTGSINLKKMTINVFFWWHIRQLGPLKYILKEYQNQVKTWLITLIMKVLNFLCLKKILVKLKTKKSICINEIFYENRFVYPIYVSYQELKNGMDLLLISDENKSHYVYIKN